MTSFLKINGWTVPVFDKGASATAAQFGRSSESWSNRVQRNHRGIADSWNANVKWQTESEADTLEALVYGENGHHFPLDDDAFSANEGLGPEDGSTYTIETVTLDTTAPRFGRGFMRILTSNTVTWNPRVWDNKWTIGYWKNDSGTWVHRWVRSDGSKWADGVQADLTSTSELTVSDGGVLFSGAIEIDDVVIIPANADADFLEQSYLWMVAYGLTHYYPLEDNADDTAGSADGTLVGSPAFAQVKISDGMVFDGTDDEVTLPVSVVTDLDGATGATVDGWAEIDSTMGAVERAVIHLRRGSSGIDAKLQFLFENDGSFNVRSKPDAADSQFTGGSTAGNEFPLDTLFHFAVVFDLIAETISVYKNGTIVETFDASSSWVTGAFDAAGNDAGLGKGLNTSNFFKGKLGDVKLFHRALTAAQIADNYRIGNYRRRFQLAQPFSDLPYLVLDGDIVHYRQREVLGENASSSYFQHGGSDGWLNNTRPMMLRFDIKRLRAVERVPIPMMGWLGDRGYLNTAGTVLDDFSRALGAVKNGVTVLGKSGPFDYGEAIGLAGIGDFLFVADVGKQLTGLSSITVAMWIKRDVAGGTQTLLQIARSAVVTKIELTLASDALEVTCSPNGSAQTFTSSNTLTDTGEFHLVACNIDLVEDTMSTWIDGVVDDSETSSGFTATAFDDTSGNGAFGGFSDSSQRFNGDVAATYLYPRKLTVGEHRQLFELGRRGVLR